MKTTSILDYVVTYNSDNSLIQSIVDDQGRSIDFSDKERIHVVALYYSKDGCTINNLYALDQEMRVSWSPGIVAFLLSYMSNPAVSYLAIHNLASEDTIKRMRKILGEYVFHISSKASVDRVDEITKYLRVLTCVGNKAIADRLETALAQEKPALAFMNEMVPLLLESAQVVNYVKMLELYFGKIKRELVTMAMLQDIPLPAVETRRATKAISDWAFENGLIVEEQRV